MTGRPHQKATIRPNGEIIWPLAGTIRWVDGERTGIWGLDFKVVPMLLADDGRVRELNAMEKILYANQIAGVHP